MISLLIDTSTNIPLVALNNKNQVLIHTFLDEKKEISSCLFPAIIELLENAHIVLNDLKFIALGAGPGSYTGLRVGAAAGKSLSYALGIPLVSFCSLKSFISPQSGPFFSVIDAKSGGIYLLEGIKSDSSILYKDPLLLPLEEAEKRITKDHYIVSPHIAVIKQKFAHFNLQEEKFSEAYPDAGHLAKIAFNKMQNNNFNFFDKLNLLYLRGPSPLAL